MDLADLDPTIYVDRLRAAMRQLQATPRSQTRPYHLPEALQQCTHVFVRHDAVRKLYKHLMMAHSKSSVVKKSTSPSMSKESPKQSALTA
eukprot:gene12348-biopygen9846